jgi:hypothetical protein
LKQFLRSNFRVRCDRDRASATANINDVISSGCPQDDTGKQTALLTRQRRGGGLTDRQMRKPIGQVTKHSRTIHAALRPLLFASAPTHDKLTTITTNRAETPTTGESISFMALPYV